MRCFAEVRGLLLTHEPLLQKPFWIREIEAECDSNLAVDKRMSEEEGSSIDTTYALHK